jgi:hypothetical protein
MGEIYGFKPPRNTMYMINEKNLVYNPTKNILHNQMTGKRESAIALDTRKKILVTVYEEIKSIKGYNNWYQTRSFDDNEDVGLQWIEGVPYKITIV